MNKTQLDMMLAAADIKLMPATKLIYVESTSVITENKSGRLELPCDTVMMAMGSTPTEDLANALEDICPVYVTGEAKRGAADVIAAVENAYQAVCAL